MPFEAVAVAAGINVNTLLGSILPALERQAISLVKILCVTSQPRITAARIRFGQMQHRLADWLQRCRIKTVAMESTGVFWVPLFQILEQRGFEVRLVNAHHVKSVPGHKTDVSDFAQFID
jgi:transposase